MKSALLRLAGGLVLAGGMSASALFAAEETRVLPTLLIKGEVVSVDANDPGGTLLKVKDRYGFETPIYFSAETKITQGGEPLAAANLAVGTEVEVEYNFDVNTAKRHAVLVKTATPPSAEAAQGSTTEAAPGSAPAASAGEASASTIVPEVPDESSAPVTAIEGEATSPSAQ